MNSYEWVDFSKLSKIWARICYNFGQLKQQQQQNQVIWVKFGSKSGQLLYEWATSE